MEKKYFVYMLQCADDTIYTGYTNNLDKRVARHNEGKASKCTRARLPVRLVYCEQFETKSEALKRECEIKKLHRSQKLDLIRNHEEDYFEKISSNK